jgi:hypothetical protein
LHCSTTGGCSAIASTSTAATVTRGPGTAAVLTIAAVACLGTDCTEIVHIDIKRRNVNGAAFARGTTVATGTAIATVS